MKVVNSVTTIIVHKWDSNPGVSESISLQVLLTLYEALVHWVLSSDKSCLRRFRANTDDRES